MNKTCPICKKVFINLNNKKTCSKECYNAYNKTRKHNYYLKTQKKWLEYKKLYAKKHQEDIKIYAKMWKRQQMKKNINFRLKNSLCARMYKVLKSNTKVDKTYALIGCSPAYLKKHIESQFTEGMSWDNYGKFHIDHIIPCASFDLSKPEKQKKCFHYTNLQPLWAADNLSKGAKLCYEKK